ncbi:MAG: indole-3-glycerol phosphate synthase TrpC [Deltaproteobacteria bacterium]|nr:indole-3-glycerol phosphate synthase TrpC [Deltaproteobacteria bacterium]MCB9785889.1 indole-3-glycerol phosphate synthase TrpC [Deltaproteobacteria bacterium]
MTRVDILQRILDETRERLRSAPPDEAALREQVATMPPPPDALASLRAPGVRVIAEVKRQSPSAGIIRAGVDPLHFARAYANAGAAAISVLTEPVRFGGSLADLASVAAEVAVPCLRKDFIVDAVQLVEARAAGASMALLIVAALEQRELARLLAEAQALGLTALVEVHTADELARALDAGATVVGVNNRDLKTFQIDLAVCEGLRPSIPAGVVAIAESGVTGPADVARLRRSGYDVFLVGQSLMTSSDPQAALAALIEAS